MKYLSLVAAILLFISCDKGDVIDNGGILACLEVEYGESFNIKQGESICFPDGKSFSLESITPEFCPCDVICVWEGAFALVLETTIQNGGKELVDLFVTTTSEPQLIFEGYNIPNISADLNDPDVSECDNDNIDVEKVTITMSVSAI